MTSSLVGSEMCIRDRLCACPGAKRHHRANGYAKRRHSNIKPPSSQEASSCLLYTSDAADDM
eukprot:11015814-Prorocentrum_lima.AAC.1